VRNLFLACLTLSFALAAPALAKVETEVVSSLEIEATPLAVASAADGKRLFVLADSAEILVFDSGGNLTDRIAVDKGTDGLQIMGRGDQLLLKNSGKKMVSVLDVAFIQEINIAGAPIKGPANAPVTIVVFDDFQCPYCSRLAPMLKEVLAAYPKEVKLAYKHYPLRNHRYARPAAAASLAANEQGMFWEYHDLLFANYNQLNELKFLEFARQLGLNIKRFEEDMKSPAYQNVINTDTRDGIAAGVRGTPAVFINGRPLKDRSIGGFKKIIDNELEKAGK